MTSSRAERLSDRDTANLPQNGEAVRKHVIADDPAVVKGDPADAGAVDRPAGCRHTEHVTFVDTLDSPEYDHPVIFRHEIRDGRLEISYGLPQPDDMLAEAVTPC